MESPGALEDREANVRGRFVPALRLLPAAALVSLVVTSGCTSGPNDATVEPAGDASTQEAATQSHDSAIDLDASNGDVRRESAAEPSGATDASDGSIQHADSGSGACNDGCLCTAAAECSLACPAGNCEALCTDQSNCTVDCPLGDCKTECLDMATCASSCGPSGDCEGLCEGSDCTLDCPGGTCFLDCGPGAHCNLACPGGSCEVVCREGATCTLDCPSGNCTMSCQPTSDCTALCEGGACDIACESGATCR